MTRASRSSAGTTQLQSEASQAGNGSISAAADEANGSTPRKGSKAAKEDFLKTVILQPGKAAGRRKGSQKVAEKAIQRRSSTAAAQTAARASVADAVVGELNGSQKVVQTPQRRSSVAPVDQVATDSKAEYTADRSRSSRQTVRKAPGNGALTAFAVKGRAPAEGAAKGENGIRTTVKISSPRVGGPAASVVGPASDGGGVKDTQKASRKSSLPRSSAAAEGVAADDSDPFESRRKKTGKSNSQGSSTASGRSGNLGVSKASSSGVRSGAEKGGRALQSRWQSGPQSSGQDSRPAGGNASDAAPVRRTAGVSEGGQDGTRGLMDLDEAEWAKALDAAKTDLHRERAGPAHARSIVSDHSNRPFGVKGAGSRASAASLDFKRRETGKE